MTNYYCEYCGAKSASITNLTAANCQRHPNGNHKGKHKLYEGSEKTQYNCKFCGVKSTTIQNLTASKCQRHPNGSHKGNHAPAL